MAVPYLPSGPSQIFTSLSQTQYDSLSIWLASNEYNIYSNVFKHF